MGLGAVAAGVRTVAWLRTAALFDDGPAYLALAQAILEGDGSSVLRHPYHPLYPAAVAAVSLLGAGLETAAAAVSVASGAATVVAFTAWLDDAFDRRTAWVGGWLLALHPWAVSFSADVQSDGLYLALFAWSALFLYRGIGRGRWPETVAGGAFSGLAYLARPEGLGLALLGGVAALCWTPGVPRAGRVRLVAGAGLVLAAAVPVALYVGALRLETGTFQLTQKKSVAGLAGLAESAQLPTSSALAMPAALPRADDRFPPRSPGERLTRAAGDLYRTSVSVFRFELLPFLVLGLAAARGRPGWRGLFVGGIAGTYFVVLAALVWSAGYVSRRHALPPLVPVFGYAASGLVLAADWASRRVRRTLEADVAAAPWAAVLAAVLLLALAWGPRDLAPRRMDRLAERRAAEWVRTSTLGPGAVAAGRPRVAYYAGRPFVPLPSSPDEGMLAYLASRDVRAVIVDDDKIGDHAGLREARDAGLVLLHRAREAGHTASVYGIAPRSGETPRSGEGGRGPAPLEAPAFGDPASGG